MTNFDSQKTESNLFVDIGNSAVKIAFRSGGKWIVHSHKTGVEAANQVNNHTYPVNKIIISSVRENVKTSFEREVEAHLIQSLTVNEIEPELLDYETPETLGIDRYFGCLGARVYTDSAVVVIDSGSACTIDYMTKDGVFKGGVIMPGLTSILNIFTKTAPELPQIEIKYPKHFPGKSTKESLELGQVVFFADGISRMLERYTSVFGEYDLFISGGDADVIKELIVSKGLVNKNLVFDGMEKMILADS